MVTKSVNTNPVQVGNIRVPREGPRTINQILDFTTNSTIELDGTQLNASNKMSVVQGVYLDNSGSTSPLIVNNLTSGQTITCPPNSQGFFPLFAPMPFSIQFIGFGVKKAVLYNVPIVPHVWGVGGNPSFNGAGYQYVSEPYLDATLQGDVIRTKLVTEFVDCSAINVTTATTSQLTILSASPNWFLKGISIQLSANAAIAAAGLVTWSIRNGTTVLFTGTVWVPAAGATPAIVTPDFTVWENQNLDLKGGTSTLNFIAGTALTAGAWRINALAATYTPNQ